MGSEGFSACPVSGPSSPKVVPRTAGFTGPAHSAVPRTGRAISRALSQVPVQGRDPTLKDHRCGRATGWDSETIYLRPLLWSSHQAGAHEWTFFGQGSEPRTGVGRRPKERFSVFRYPLGCAQRFLLWAVLCRVAVRGYDVHACSSQFFFSSLKGEARSQDPLSPGTVDKVLPPAGVEATVSR